MDHSTEKKLRIGGYMYDSVVSTIVTSIITTRLGYETMFDRTSEEAIVNIPRADVVISDVTGGGYEVYGAARACNKPIIFLDGGALEIEKVPEAIVVSKPFPASQLEEAVRRCAESLKPNTPQ
jgi:hypothetical protein